MEEQHFIELIEKAQNKFSAHPEYYKRKIYWFTLLGGYGIFLVLATIAVSIIVGAAILLINYPNLFIAVMLKKLGIIPVIMALWAIISIFSLRTTPPEGYPIDDYSSTLQATMGELKSTLDLPPIHQLLITDDLNAAAAQYPKYGLFGKQQNILILGLPLLILLSPEQVKSVIAHELGHFSRNHSKLSNWIYRTRISWQHIYHHVSQQQSFILRPLQAYLDWFYPRLQAASFVIARENEYEADTISVSLTSPNTAAGALAYFDAVAIPTYQSFWDKVWQKNRVSKALPRSPWSDLQAYRYIFFNEHKAQIQKAYKEAMQIKTGYEDTHPCLSDRIKNMNVQQPSITHSKISALDYYFPEEKAAILSIYNNDWQEKARDSWQENYEKAQADKQIIKTLLPKENKTREEWLKLGQALDEWEKSPQALKCYQNVIKLHEQTQTINEYSTQYAQVARRVAQLLFAKNTDIKKIQPYVEKTHADILVAADTYRDYLALLKTQEDTKTATEWEAKAQPIYAQVEEFIQERRHLSKHDTFITPEITDEALARIYDILETYPVSHAFLAEKQVQHRPDIPVLILACKTKLWTINDDCEEAIEQALSQTFSDVDVVFFVIRKNKKHKLFNIVKKSGLDLKLS